MQFLYQLINNFILKKNIKSKIKSYEAENIFNKLIWEKYIYNLYNGKEF